MSLADNLREKLDNAPEVLDQSIVLFYISLIMLVALIVSVLTLTWSLPGTSSEVLEEPMP